MNRQSRVATWLGAILGLLCALGMSSLAHAGEASARLSEEFHQTYALAAGGRVSLENINGPVHISAWDRDEVKVDAVKRAGSKERLAEAKIEVEAGKDYVSIRTEYPDRHHRHGDDDWDNPASVEYTLTVPRNARLDEISLINGSLDVEGSAGEVRASCINGKLTARGLSGRVNLSTINNRVEAQFERLGPSVELSSVNGGVRLTLPSDAKAEVEASTVHGDISNEFGLNVNHHRWVGHDLHGELGGGGTRIKLGNVNGEIEIRRAGDNHAMSPAKDLQQREDRDDDDDDEI